MEKINILCATDRNFLYPTYVTLYSVIKNHAEYEIDFYVLLNQDVPQEESDKLRKFVESFGKKCFFYEVKEGLFDDYILCEKFPLSAYYRLLAHTYLPKSVHKILYIDVDLIVDKNIYEFYSTDLTGKYLASTSHNPIPDFYNNLDIYHLNIESAAKGEFFNSGVLLMNLDMFREHNITIKTYDKAYKYCEDHGCKVFYDQGLLNFMFYDKTIYFSSMDYNFRFSIERDYADRLDPERDYKKAIIHYTGMKQLFKPWDLRLTNEEIEEFGNVPYSGEYFYISKDLNDLCEIWWSYAESTPIYDSLMRDVEIKNKWFRRNLKDYFLKNNERITSKNSKIRSLEAKKQTVVYVPKYPDDFKSRTYNIALKFAKPYFKLRDLKNKIFKQ